MLIQIIKLKQNKLFPR